MKQNNSSFQSLKNLISKKKDGINFTRIDFSFFLSRLNDKLYNPEIICLFTLLDVKKITYDEILDLLHALNSDVKKISILQNIHFDKLIIDYFEFKEKSTSLELILAPLFVGFGFNYFATHSTTSNYFEPILSQLDAIAVSSTFSKEWKINSIIEDAGMVVLEQQKKIIPYFDEYLNTLIITQAHSALLFLVIFLLNKFKVKNSFLILNLKVGNDELIKNTTSGKRISEIILNLANEFDHKIIIFLTNSESLISKYYGINIGIKKVNDFFNKIPMLADLSQQIKKIITEVCYRTNLLQDKLKVQEKYDDLINSKKALNIFHRFTAKQKGANLIRYNNFKVNKYFSPKFEYQIKAKNDGYLKFNSCKVLDDILYSLKVYSKNSDDKLDPQSGIIFNKIDGEKLNQDEIIATLYSSSNIDDNLIKQFEDNILITQNKDQAPTKPYILNVADNLNTIKIKKNEGKKTIK